MLLLPRGPAPSSLQARVHSTPGRVATAAHAAAKPPADRAALAAGLLLAPPALAVVRRRGGRRRQAARRALSDEKDLNVEKLLRKYGGEIKAIRRTCVELLEGCDDTFVLRFAVEHKGDVVAAVKNVRQVIQWRKTRGKKIVASAAEAVAKATAGGGWDNAPVLAAAPHSESVAPYLTGPLGLAIVVVSFPNGDLCSCIRASAINDEELMNKVSVEQMTEFFLFTREVNFLVAEQRTRANGRLCRLLAANDLTGVSKFPDDRFQKALTESSSQATMYYPGFAGPTVILNLPEVVRVLIQFFVPLFPGAVQERLKFARGPMAYLKDLADALKEPIRSQFIEDLEAVLKD